jgi:hypothetical protein
MIGQFRSFVLAQHVCQKYSDAVHRKAVVREEVQVVGGLEKFWNSVKIFKLNLNFKNPLKMTHSISAPIKSDKSSKYVTMNRPMAEITASAEIPMPVATGYQYRSITRNGAVTDS